MNLAFSVPMNSMMTSYRNSNVLGFDINGNLIYHNSGNGLTVVDTDGNQVGSNIPSTRTFAGASHLHDGRMNTRRFGYCSRAASNNLSAPTIWHPTFGIEVTANLGDYYALTAATTTAKTPDKSITVMQQGTASAVMYTVPAGRKFQVSDVDKENNYYNKQF